MSTETEGFSLDAEEPKPKRVNLLDLLGREMAKMGPDWEVYKFEWLNGGDKLYLEGAVAPIKTRGKWKGHRNWNKLDKATIRKVVATSAEIDEFKAAWSAKTGLCTECTGTGDRFASWNIADGTKYKTCRDCGGTGKAVSQR